jgi:hypothetical protein
MELTRMDSTSIHSPTTASRDTFELVKAEQLLPDHTRIAAERILSDAYSLWGVCAKSACRRARCCRGAGGECLAAWIPSLAPDVVDGGLCMLEGQLNSLSFDELYARHPDEIAALARWRWCINLRSVPPRRPSSVKHGRRLAPPHHAR